MRNAAEPDALETALIDFGGDCNKAAKSLGTDRSTVYRMVSKLGLSQLLGQPRQQLVGRRKLLLDA